MALAPSIFIYKKSHLKKKKSNSNNITLSDKASTIKGNECNDIEMEALKKVKDGATVVVEMEVSLNCLMWSECY